MDLRITRRRMAIGAALTVAAAGAFAVKVWKRRSAPDFDFVPLTDPDGFRSLAAGDVSAGPAMLAGLRGTPGAPEGEAVGRVRENLCRALFGGGATAPDSVPIAFFSDYRCPYCRVLTGLLRDVEKDSSGVITIAWHEWPILGEDSEQAARAALAARRQGAYAAFHGRLARSAFAPTPAYLANLSRRSGIDADRLLRDMHGPGVERELAETRALAALFGFPGTPGLVVGRTAVIGAIDEARLRALIARERADGPIPACAAGGRG
jgi:predicted DsbA family dithiol-disulfide isomerase